jgi:hypothetical protein
MLASVYEDAATWPTTCRVPMPFSFNHLYLNAPYFNGFHLSTAGNFNVYTFHCVPGNCFTLPAGLCLSYCLTRLYHKITLKNYISLVNYHTQTTEQLYSVRKPLKHIMVEIWMHCDQDGWSN